MLRQTGLTGRDGGVSAVKNGGESDRLIRKAERAESAHPRTYSRVSRELFASEGLDQDRQHM